MLSVDADSVDRSLNFKLSIRLSNNKERIMSQSVNLYKQEDLALNNSWRFLPDSNILIARKPIILSNTELTSVLKTKQYHVASMADLKQAFAPFDANNVYLDKTPKFPWGNNVDMSDAPDFYKRTGISRSGIALGIHPNNYWVVLRDGIRVGGAYNVLGVEAGEKYDFTADSEANSRAVLRGDIASERASIASERASIEGAKRANLRGGLTPKVARPAGYFAEPSVELEGNEAYLLIKKPIQEEVEFFKKVREVTGNRLSADGGILILTQPDLVNKTFSFSAAGKCQDCPNIDTITATVLKKIVKDATGLEGKLLPEYKGWNASFQKPHSRVPIQADPFVENSHG
jgi:hypothetical protein